jgi:signal transduction histidine kinase
LIADRLPAVWDKDPNAGRQNLHELRLLTRGALAEMRALLLELRPAAMAETQLAELLRQLTQAFIGRTRIPVTLTANGNALLPPKVQMMLYRITQEALNNTARHANASHAEVTLQCQADMAIIQIRDDGRGFQIDNVPADHLGLGIIHERAASIGAKLKIESEIGHGTSIEITWFEQHNGGSP